jgi:pimeloyl-ACP methyl ester carboxylesterase
MTTNQGTAASLPEEPVSALTPVDPVDGQEISVLGAKAMCYRGGHGPALPLVLLHGGGFDSARTTWAPIWNELQGSGPILAPDLPGFGATPLAMQDPSIQKYSDWVLALLDQAGVQQCVLAGLSLGGAIALQVSLRSPDRVLALGLLAPYGISPRNLGGRAGWVLVHSPGVGVISHLILRHSRAAVARSLATLLHRPGTLTDALIDDVSAVVGEPQAGRAWQLIQRDEVRWTGPATDLRPSLKRLTCPVVFLSSEHDLVPPSDVLTAAEAVPNGRFRLIDGAGHWLTRDAPAEVAAELIKLRVQAAQRDGAGPQR